MPHKFKIGQRVKVSELNYWSGVYGRIGIVKNSNTWGVLVCFGDRLHGFGFNELTPVDNLCPVCEQEIETENNKIKEHKHNNQLCYGSYTPCSN